jgi:putative transcriptional regulator
LNTFLEFYNITQKELADCTGINRNTIGRYCNNTFEKIDKSHLSLLCSFFKCSLNDLFEIDIDLNIKYPSPVIQQAIMSMPVPQNLVITKGIDMSTLAETTIRYVKPDSSTDPTFGMSKEELEEIKNISTEYQIRFEKELKLDELISKFLDTLLDSLFANLDFDPSVIEVFQKSKGYDYFTTNLKVDKFHTYFYRFIAHYSEDDIFIKIINDIKRIYDSGGLEKLSDDELDNLKNIIESFIKNDYKKD